MELELYADTQVNVPFFHQLSLEQTTGSGIAYI